MAAQKALCIQEIIRAIVSWNCPDIGNVEPPDAEGFAIFQEFSRAIKQSKELEQIAKNQKLTLFRCILVSKAWATATIPYLWKYHGNIVHLVAIWDDKELKKSCDTQVLKKASLTLMPCGIKLKMSSRRRLIC
jgi:hypothetical protein